MKKDRAVLYARVSTEEEEQLNAIEKQIEENKSIIVSKGWELVDEYVDRGKSGTQVKKRDEYQRLFEDMATDKFDIIVIKDQDRLMRNPKDWYIFIDQLVQNGKRLYVYLDGTFYNPDNSFITGIKAIMAEEYSRHLSKKMNNAHRNRQINGLNPIITNRTWGYLNNKGKITIDENERGIIELIFEMYSKGYGSRIICKAISDIGVKNRKGRTLAESTIRAIVRNPLYKGTAVMNKEHLDFNTKKIIKYPQNEWIYHEDMVPAIISNELWEKANNIIDKNIKSLGGKTVGRKTGSNILSGKVICGECGELFWRNQRKTQRQNDNSNDVYWYCSEYYRYGKRDTSKGGCDSLRLKEEEIYTLLEDVGNDVIGSKEQGALLNKILDKMASILEDNRGKEQLQRVQEDKEEIIKQKDTWMDKLIKGVITDADYQRRDKDLETKLQELEDKEKKLLKLVTGRTDVRKRLEQIREVFETGKVNGISVPFMASHLKKMLVYKDRMDFYFDFLDPGKPLVATAELEGRKRNFSMCNSLG